MSRLICTVLATIAILLQVTVHAVDISKHKNVRLELQDKDSVDQAKAGFFPPDQESVFIGDLILGKRYADETIFRRVIELENPSNSVQSTTLNISVSDGNIHYVSVRNTQGSYAVVCENADSLGGRRTSFNIRMPSNSRTTLTLVIAAHNYVARS